MTNIIQAASHSNALIRHCTTLQIIIPINKKRKCGLIIYNK